MESMTELVTYVKSKAISYLSETGTALTTFPDSIVDFVVEYIVGHCHFPKYYTEKQIVGILEKGKDTIAFNCAEIYGKVGVEGEKEHTENGVTRVYETSWISFNLLSHFPNYARLK